MSKEYKSWKLFDEMPEGFRVHPCVGSPLHGYEFISKGSPLKGNTLALCRVKELAEPINDEIVFEAKKVEQPVKQSPEKIHPNTPRVLNELARKQTILMILNDVMLDLAICEIEGWSKSEYLNELKREICKIALREDVVTGISIKVASTK